MGKMTMGSKDPNAEKEAPKKLVEAYSKKVQDEQTKEIVEKVVERVIEVPVEIEKEVYIKEDMELDALYEKIDSLQADLKNKHQNLEELLNIKCEELHGFSESLNSSIIKYGDEVDSLKPVISNTGFRVNKLEKALDIMVDKNKKEKNTLMCILLIILVLGLIF